MLVQTPFMLKPLYARRKKTLGDAAAGGWKIERVKKRVSFGRKSKANKKLQPKIAIPLHFRVIGGERNLNLNLTLISG